MTITADGVLMIHAFPLWNGRLAAGRLALAEAGAFVRAHLA